MVEGLPMNALNNLVAAVDRLGRVIITIGIAVIAITMVAQVFFRYVINSSLYFAEELSIYTLIWTSFIGAFMLVRNWEHITITVFVNMLPFRLRAALFLVAKFFCLIFIAIVVYYGFEMVIQSAHRNSPSLLFSTRWIKLAIPVSAVLMVVFIVNEIVRDILAFRKRDTAYFDRLGEGGTL